MNKLHLKLKFQKKTLTNKVSIVCGLHFMPRFLLTHSLLLHSVINIEIEIILFKILIIFSQKSRLISYRTYYSKLTFLFNKLNYLRSSMSNLNLAILNSFVISFESFFVCFCLRKIYNSDKPFNLPSLVGHVFD